MGNMSRLASFRLLTRLRSEADLHNVIRRGNILKETHKSYVMYQLLKAMKYLHSANVIHRDMKVNSGACRASMSIMRTDLAVERLDQSAVPSEDLRFRSGQIAPSCV